MQNTTRGECQKGIHTVDFLIWRILPGTFGNELRDYERMSDAHPERLCYKE